MYMKKILVWFSIAIMLISVGGGVYFYTQSQAYVTPGGVTLMHLPQGWQSHAEALTWDTQNLSRGEHIESAPRVNPAEALVPPYIIVNLGPETSSITVENYVRDLKREIPLAGGRIVSEQPINIAEASGYDLELTMSEEGMSLRSRVVVLRKEGMIYQITAVAEERDWIEYSSSFDKAIASLKLTR